MNEKMPIPNTIFPIGEKNTAYAQYFVGQSYLNMLTTKGLPIGNVTFEPGCRNNWHIHHARSGGGQILLCTTGRGYYQAWGAQSRRRGGDPSRGQALARSCPELLVFPPGYRDPR